MRIRMLGAFLVLTLCLAGPVASADPADSGWVHPYDFPQTDKAPEELYAVIEIPAGGFIKYELDKNTGHVMVDRFVRMPVTYPANYGSITQTLGGDGDPLDILVITRAPLHPGSIIKVRPIAILKSTDNGDVDDKVVAVPVSKLDPTYDEIRDAKDLPALERQRLEAFFRVYKDLKDKDAIVIKGWAEASEAKKMVRLAIDAHMARRATP